MKYVPSLIFTSGHILSGISDSWLDWYGGHAANVTRWNDFFSSNRPKSFSMFSSNFTALQHSISGWFSACDWLGFSVGDQDRSDRIRWDQKEFECITWFDKRLLIYFVTQREITARRRRPDSVAGRFDSKSWFKWSCSFLLDQSFILNRFEWFLPDLNH